MRRSAVERAGALVSLAVAAGAGCIATGGSEPTPACVTAADCNGAAGEECDEGVCWGDPPSGKFAAVLSPRAGDGAARTEIERLGFTVNGWLTSSDDLPPQLMLASTVRLQGPITAPCPPNLAGCNGSLAVPARVRFSRVSPVDGSRVTVEAVTDDSGYVVVLPRPTELTTYQVTVLPSDMPLGAGLPSAAELVPPRRLQVTLDPASGGDTRQALVLGDPGSGRILTGSVVRPPPGNLVGWRVHVEAGVGEVGALERVSNLARLDATGTYKLWVPLDRGPVELVLSPPPAMGTADSPPPGLRRRNLVVEQLMNLPALTVPALGDPSLITVRATGTGGGGDPETPDGAQVQARMDQAIAPDLYLVHTALAPTNEHGVAAVPLWMPPGGLRHDYVLDVLPRSGSELAARFGWELPLEVGVASTLSVTLARRSAIRGTAVDADGAPIAGATVTARVSAGTRCALSQHDLLLARSLSAPTATTEADGGFVLWVDPALGEQPLRYDVTVEPPPGSAPSWSFDDTEAGGDLRLFQVPAGAHVRGLLVRADGAPADGTLVQVYQSVAAAEPCTLSGDGERAALRAVGTSDEAGIVRMVLPRADDVTPR